MILENPHAAQKGEFWGATDENRFLLDLRGCTSPMSITSAQQQSAIPPHQKIWIDSSESAHQHGADIFNQHMPEGGSENI